MRPQHKAMPHGFLSCLVIGLAAALVGAAPRPGVQVMPPWHVSQPWNPFARATIDRSGTVTLSTLSSILPYLLPPILDALDARGYAAYPALYATALPFSANFPSQAVVDHFLAREPKEQNRYFTLVPVVYHAEVVQPSQLRARDFQIRFRLELFARDSSGHLGALLFGKDFAIPFTAREDSPTWEDVEPVLPVIASKFSRLAEWDTVAARIPDLSRGFQTRFIPPVPDSADPRGRGRRYFAQAEAFGNFRGGEVRVAKADFRCLGRTGRALNDLSFPFKADERWPEFLYAAIIRPDGVVIRVPSSEAHVEQSPGALPGKVYDWSRVMVVNLSGLVPGATVTYAIRFHQRYAEPRGRRLPDPNLAKDMFVFPVDGQGFRIHAWAEAGDTVRFAAHQAMLDSVRATPVGSFTLYEAMGRGQPVPRGETDSDGDEFHPLVRLSNRRDWADLLRETRDSIFSRIPPLRQVASPLLRAAAEDSILSIHRFIHDSLRYLAVDFGARAYVPAPPESTLARKLGDCKDFAVLMIARLRAAGIEALPALVGARFRKSLFEGPPSYDATDHMIVHLPAFGLWVDPTAGVLPPGVLPYNLSGGQALILSPDGVKVSALPRNADAEYQGETRYDCKERGEDLDCERRWIFARAQSSEWRDFLRDSPRSKWTGVIHAGAWEAACRMTETSLSVEHLDDERNGLEIRQHFIGHGAIIRAGNRAFVRLPETPFAYLFSVTAAGDSSEPLILDAPLHERVEVRLSTARPVRWPVFRGLERGGMYLRMSRPGPDRVVVEVGLPAGEIVGEDRHALLDAVARYKDFFASLLLEG